MDDAQVTRPLGGSISSSSQARSADAQRDSRSGSLLERYNILSPGDLRDALMTARGHTFGHAGAKTAVSA